MATKKQRKRTQKERRHEYEKVWILPDGSESTEPPDDYVEPAPHATRTDERKPSQKASRRQSQRSTRTPLPPSWRRATKRALLLGVVIFVIFGLLNAKHGASAYVSALLLAVLYTALFIPFTFYIDRFAYRRWQRKMAEQPKKR
jgi:hypothetical protein